MREGVCDVVPIQRFVCAARDSGYKDISAALAELIDNSLQASAKTIRIVFEKSSDKGLRVTVSDDGEGMKPSRLRTALQFGGSSRFDSRSGAGRFGMGLPNSSLSQARRLEVISWTTKNNGWWTHLDVEEIVSGIQRAIPAPRRIRTKIANTKSGTIVVWEKCDRIVYGDEDAFFAKIRRSLGQIFRKKIQSGIRVTVNGETVTSIDPLFLYGPFAASQPFGPKLDYKINIPNGTTGTSSVTAQFVMLPIEKWHSLWNEQKKAMGISKRAGVSILRAGREIDYGWFFMGSKRKENYDDWWRCEICFEPDLDELFGVTNTKQGIRPTEELIRILTPDLEQIARQLNGQVRSKYASIRIADERGVGERIAIQRDHLIEPPEPINEGRKLNLGIPSVVRNNRAIRGLSYRFDAQRISQRSFFVPTLAGNEIVVLLNKAHPFYECIYGPSVRLSSQERKMIRQIVELMLLSASRAECRVALTDKGRILERMREEWGGVLATFLE
jgi:hypothetical protein